MNDLPRHNEYMPINRQDADNDLCICEIEDDEYE